MSGDSPGTGIKEQTARAVSVDAKYAFLLHLQMESIN
jgi:hypothetical protein